MQLEGSSGQKQAVSDDGRAAVVAASVEMDLLHALEHGLAFRMHDSTVTPTGAGDYFVKIANTNTEGYELVIHQVYLEDAGAEVLTAEVGDNYTSATSHAELEPVNRKVGDSKLASSYGQFESDVDITGQGTLTEAGRVTVSAGVPEADLFGFKQAPLVLGANQSMSLLAATGTSAIYYSIDFYFRKAPLK